MSDKRYSMDQINRLFDMFTKNGLTKFSMKDKDFQITLEKENRVCDQGNGSYINNTMDMGAPVSKKEMQNTDDSDDSGKFVLTAPIIGCYYEAPSPESDPFVSIGSKVLAGDVLCIIESMKLMNEVKGEVSGTVDKIFVKNGEVLEYGQPIMRIILEED